MTEIKNIRLGFIETFSDQEKQQQSWLWGLGAIAVLAIVFL